MSLVTELQLSIFNKIKEEICSTLRYDAVGKMPSKSKLPFWIGKERKFHSSLPRTAR